LAWVQLWAELMASRQAKVQTKKAFQEKTRRDGTCGDSKYPESPHRRWLILRRVVTVINSEVVQIEKANHAARNAKHDSRYDLLTDS